METPEQFSSRAARLLAEGKRLSERQTGDWGDLNRLLAEAKTMRLSWIDGLCFAVERMRAVG